MNTTEMVKAATAVHYELTTHDLDGPWRHRRLVRARQVAQYLARRLTKQSMPQIGRRFGRDHTTVLYAIRTVEDRLRDDIQLAEDIEAILLGMRAFVTSKSQEQLAISLTIADQLQAFRQDLKQAFDDVADDPREDELPREAERPTGRPPAGAAGPLLAASKAVVTAFTTFENDQYTRGEQRALERLLGACRSLRGTIEAKTGERNAN